MRMLPSAVLLLSTAGAVIPALADDAALLAPGVISTACNETSAAFSPDGREVYFMRGDLASSRTAILSARRNDDGSYGDVRLAPFSGTWNDSEPHVSPDGRRLYFVSNRPVHAGGASLVATRGRVAFPGANLWYVARKDDGWGDPVHIGGDIARVPMVYNPSVAANGNLYFSAHREDAGAGFQVYRAVPDGEGWSAPVQVPLGKGVQANHMDPAIDPRERFMLFAGDEGASVGAADIYIVFRGTDGAWGSPIRLPGEVNSRFLENAPSLGRAFGEIYVTSMRPAPSRFPRDDNDLAALNRHLDGPLNGSRNLWRFDIADLLREHGISD